MLSYCEVLRERSVPYETIDRIIQHIAGREYDRRKLLLSASWLNGVIVDLITCGWTIYRATELFFIGVFSEVRICEIDSKSFSDALSLTYLTHIHNDENSQSILEHLKTNEFVKHDYSDCLRPEYTIPGLIASLLDASNITSNKLSYGFQSNYKGSADEKNISIDEISAALGYHSDLAPKSIESIYKVHTAPKCTSATPVDLDFEVLGPSSFQNLDGPLTSGKINRTS